VHTRIVDPRADPVRAQIRRLGRPVFTGIGRGKCIGKNPSESLMEPNFVVCGSCQLPGPCLHKTLQALSPQRLRNLIEIRLRRVINPMPLVVVSDLRRTLLKFAFHALCEDLLYVFAVGKQNMRTIIPGKAIALETEDMSPVVRLGFVNLAALMTDVERGAEP